MAAGAKLDKRQLLAAEANRKVSKGCALMRSCRHQPAASHSATAAVLPLDLLLADLGHWLAGLKTHYRAIQLLG